MRYLSPFLAILLTLLSGLVIFSFFDKPPLLSLYIYFIMPLDSLYGWSELLIKAAPLALIGVGLSIGFRANVWNIGAEGQFTAGALAAGGLAIWQYDSTSLWLLPGMMLMGVLGGMVWAAGPAWLKSRFNVNEILSSLMLSYVSLQLLHYLVNGPWRDPDGYNFPETRFFPDVGQLPRLFEGTRMHIGVFFALLAVLGGWILMRWMLAGYQLRSYGLSPRAAHFAGFREKRLLWRAMMISGGLAGFAGMCEVSGLIGQLHPSISPGYGFTAIIVAFLGRLNPMGVLFASLVMALTYVGGETAQIELGMPNAVTGLFQGVLLFYLLACDTLIVYRIVPARRPAQRSALLN